MYQKDLKNILSFLHEAEKLKTVLRHSWLSSGRRESTAEHTWRMALMAIVMQPYLENKIDLGHALQIIIVHDLCEVYAGDHYSWKGVLKNKAQIERKAVKRIVKNLSKANQKKIVGLWEEYEACRTSEAKFAKALDKLEVMIQHNEADVKKNNRKEFKFNLIHGLTHCAYSNFLKEFREQVRTETLKIYKKHRKNPKLYA